MWEEYAEQLRSFGAGPWRAVPTLLWDGRFALLTVLLAGFGRAAAEVGAVMVVGGNIEGFTRTMTTAIALETSKGDLPLALALGLLLMAIVLGVNALAQGLRDAALRRGRPDAAGPGRRAICFAAGGVAILDRVSLTIAAGPPLLIIGPNGAGKSVLLRLLHGLLRPAAGRITPARRSAARMVFQRPVLLRRSVLANIRYPLALAGVPRAERGAAGGGGAGRGSGWRRWPGGRRGCSRAASSSGWRWPGPPPWRRRCCSSTSPAPASTPPPPGRWRRSSPASPPAAARS